MKVYIAYKYSNHSNKDKLKQKLDQLTDKIHSFGHSTFLLGRDIGKWNSPHLGTCKQLPKIIKNLKDSDMVVAYVDSKAFSKGLLFEVFLFKLLGKKNLLVIDNKKVHNTRLKSLFKKTVELSDINKLDATHFS